LQEHTAHGAVGIELGEVVVGAEVHANAAAGAQRIGRQAEFEQVDIVEIAVQTALDAFAKRSLQRARALNAGIVRRKIHVGLSAFDGRR